MPDTVPLAGEAVLEVISPDGARRYARIAQTPFMIGRGAETGNHLQLSDRRISRNCAAVVIEANRFYVEDRGQRRGLFVNGEKVQSRELQDGDSITFGLQASYEIFFRSGKTSDADSLPHPLTPMDPLPTPTATHLALKQQSPVITEDLGQADVDLQAAQSILAQRLRAVVVIPLFGMSRANTQESMINIKRGDFLGILYLDSRRPAAFSKLDRQILDALAADAASILDNARLVERERERQRLEHEINIA